MATIRYAKGPVVYLFDRDDLKTKKKELLWGDWLRVGDDIATQDNPAMSPELYREMLKPYQAELFQYIKARTPAKLYYHSCGSVLPLIDDLIEIGVDALNPVQVTARGMDTAELKKRFENILPITYGLINAGSTLKPKKKLT